MSSSDQRRFPRVFRHPVSRSSDRCVSTYRNASPVRVQLSAERHHLPPMSAIRVPRTQYIQRG